MTTPYNSTLTYNGMGTYNAGYTFTPPTLPVVPPVDYAQHRSDPPTKQVNPQGWNLMRYMPQRDRGVNVWKMTDGTYMMSDPVPVVTFAGTIGWPYPDSPNPVNNAISSSWFPGGTGGAGGSGPGGDIQTVNPNIAVEYQGGHTYAVSSTEATALTAVGLGAYLR